ncbi:MAG: hypothetical protein H6839_15570 [Planctomycetes bacterium]|nr:hypothetical protein [Planctomycetota bacterium]
MSVLRTLALLALLLSPAVLAAQTSGQQQPTPAEAAFIYELNRARQNPDRYDAENSLSGLIVGVTPQPPLALNLNLVNSARFHAAEMASNGYFGHQSQVTGDWPNQMAINAGYPLDSSFPGNNNYIESLAVTGTSGSSITYAPNAALKALIIDQGVSPPGHRYHMLGMTAFNATFREIGTGYAEGQGWTAGVNAAAYWAIHTGRRNTNPVWLTGFVYNDANSNGRYDQGEGLSGVTVSATGSTTGSVQSTTGGMYSMQVNAGTTNLSCSGGSFSGTATRSINVGTANLEVDFSSGRSSGELNFEFQQIGGGPVLSVSSSMSVFNSPSPATPSASQSYTVSGVRLAGIVTVTAPSEFQVSLSAGSGFGSSVTLTPSGGTLASTQVFVRFNPSGASGASGNVTHTSGGIVDTPVNVIGTVSTNPAVFCNPTSLTLPAPRLGVASAEQTYTVSGYNLSNNIVITAPADFEVSQTSGSGFSGGLTLTQSGGTVAPTTIYVRYTPTTLGATGNITNVSGGNSQNVAVTGAVTNGPVITATPASLILVSPSSGVPSAEQAFNVSGQYLGGDIALTAPSGFEFTLTSGSGYGTSINLTPSAGVVSTTTVYVRYLGGSASAGGNIDCTSTLATTKQVALSGTIAPPPNINVSTAGLTMNSQGVGVPSGERSFTVSGTNLLGNVTLTPSTDFEISLTSGSGFTSVIALTPTAGTVAGTTIFVRYVPSATGGLSGSLDASSPGATTKSIALNGSISSGGGGGGGGDSGGGGCVAADQSSIWLLALLPLIALVAVRRREA